MSRLSRVVGQKKMLLSRFELETFRALGRVSCEANVITNYTTVLAETNNQEKPGSEAHTFGQVGGGGMNPVTLHRLQFLEWTNKLNSNRVLPTTDPPCKRDGEARRSPWAQGFGAGATAAGRLIAAGSKL